MYDLSNKEAALIRETVAPIAMELLHEGFSNPEIAYLVDYDNSVLRGKGLLTYLSNLDVTCDLKVTDKTPLDERKALVLEYMNSRNIIKCASLAITVGTILTAIKNIGDFYDVIENPILNKDEIIEFIQENIVVVNRWRVLMDSMVVYTMCISKKYKEAFGDPKDQMHVISDDKAIGNNFVNLFSLPYFLELYYSVLGNECHYFEKQFEDYMFEGKNLYYWFMRPGNPLPAILEAMGTVEYNTDELVNGVLAAEAALFEEKAANG